MSAEPLNPAEVVKACLDAPSAAAWSNFVCLFQRIIAAGVIGVVRQRSARPDPALIDDLVQETYLKLCKDQCKVLRELKILDDKFIFGFMKVVAVNCTKDYFRARGTAKRGKEPEPFEETPEPATSAVGMEETVLLSEVETHLNRLVENDRDRSIFWLHHRQGFNPREIAEIPGVGLSAKGVESLLFRLKKLLQDALVPSGLPESGGGK